MILIDRHIYYDSFGKEPSTSNVTMSLRRPGVQHTSFIADNIFGELTVRLLTIFFLLVISIDIQKKYEERGYV